LGIDAVDEVVDGVVAGHDEPAAVVAHVETDGFALVLAQHTFRTCSARILA
jgi:hypothetical protein